MLIGCAAAGGLGLLPGVAGGFDPVGLLTWLALLAPAAGFLCAAHGIGPWPYGLAVPATWIFLVTWADLASSRDLAGPMGAAAAVTGLFGIGAGLGALAPRNPFAGAGVLFLVGLLLTGLPVLGGLAEKGESWGRHHPRLAAVFLDASPVVLVLDCAGWDGAHWNPLLYEHSGIEWFPRTPYRGGRAGIVLLVAGILCGEILTRRTARKGGTARARSEGSDLL